MEQVRDRAVMVYNEIKKRFLRKDILIMAHGGFNMEMCGALMERPVKYNPEFVLQNARYHHFKLNEKGKVLEATYNLPKDSSPRM